MCEAMLNHHYARDLSLRWQFIMRQRRWLDWIFCATRVVGRLLGWGSCATSAKRPRRGIDASDPDAHRDAWCFLWHAQRLSLDYEEKSILKLMLTHQGRVTHICASKLTTIGSALSPGPCQANFWTNAGILLIGPLGTNFSEISIEISTFSFKKMH